MDLRNHDPGLRSDTCHASSGDCNQVTVIKVEEVISVKEEEGPEAISFPEIKTEQESSVNKQLQIHGGKNRFPCEVCNKAFSWNSHLVIHQRIQWGAATLL